MKEKLKTTALLIVFGAITGIGTWKIAEFGVHLEQYIGVVPSNIAVFIISFAVVYGLFYASMREELR